MSGFINDEKSLATGIPNRTIGPETGSSGNATMTNRGGTSAGTNQDHESTPAPAAGIGGSAITTSDFGEHHRAEGEAEVENVMFPETDIEPVYSQIADGGDHYDHHKHMRHREEEQRREAERREAAARNRDLDRDSDLH